MRAILAILVLAALVLPTPSGAQTSDLAVTVDSTSTTSVNVGTQAGKILEFEADFVDSFTPSVANLELSCACDGAQERIDLAMSKNGGVWVAGLSVDHVDLVQGTWIAKAVGVDQSGTTETSASRNLVVTVPDTDGAPDLSVAGSSGDQIQLGAEQQLRLTVQEAFLRKVTYHIEGMPFELPLAAPHALDVSRFKTGSQLVTFEATDRSGNVATLEVTVFADDVEPEVIADLPSILYRDVPNPLRVQVKEDSSFRVSATVGSASAHADAEAGQRDLVLHITPTGGSDVLEVSVVDELLNSVNLRQDVEVRTLETDVRLHSAKLADTPAIPGETRTLTMNADVLVSPVPVLVDVMHGDRRIGEITVDGEARDHTIQVELPPGPNNKALWLRVPEGVVELAPANQSIDFAIEFFIGRVVHGDDIYHIRSDALARPQEAVGENGRYPIKAVDKENRLAYEFTVNGLALQWDPLEPETEVPVADAGRDSRGIPLPLGVLVVALAIAARRR